MSDKPDVPGWYECQSFPRFGEERVVRYFNGQTRMSEFKQGVGGYHVEDYTDFTRLVPASELEAALRADLRTAAAENDRLKQRIDQLEKALEEVQHEKAWENP